MSTTFSPGFSASPRPPAYNPAAAFVPAASNAPSGTFAPGTKVQVGGHRVVIEKYLSEGGFAHVYLVRLPKAIHGDDSAVLKRVAVPDKETLASMRTEVETMKKLQGRRHIVTYIDSHASQLKGGGYEVFLLMEYCNGGGLIDFMNTRLQNRLTEPEILKIFSDVSQGVAWMHYLKPPLLHRDLKVENVLITASGASRLYKLCDFGSTAPPRPAATSAQEGRLIEDDVQRHTTLQYRSPEMIDVYRKQPIDEKSDIWALGVLLYKLCYYKTPFEEQGQMAILNASFKYPAYPSFSDRLKKLIGRHPYVSLWERFTKKTQHLCSVRALKPDQIFIKSFARFVLCAVLMCPSKMWVESKVCTIIHAYILKIYAGRTQSEARRNQHLPPSDPAAASPPAVGAFNAPVIEEKPTIPDIVPMRRGRPTKKESDALAPKPSASPIRTAEKDPFVALDAKGPKQSTVDEVADRFPPLDQFGLLHDSGAKFAFDPDTKPALKAPENINQRVTNALADEAFGQSAAPAKGAPALARQVPPYANHGSHDLVDNRNVPSSKSMQRVETQATQAQRTPMVSTGTMTSPPPQDASSQSTNNTRPIFKFPPSQIQRPSSQPRASDASMLAAAKLRADAVSSRRPGLLEQRSRSQVDTLSVSRSPVSSRPSLEGQRPSTLEVDNSISRSKSANFKSRPVSDHVGSRMKFLRGRSPSNGPSPVEGTYTVLNATEKLPPAVSGDFEDTTEPIKIDSNVEFLRAMEEEDPSRRKEKRMSGGSKHVKRSSMPSISLSGTKNILAGRFGDAFRRFETNTNEAPLRTSSPSPDRSGTGLTPIAGSEATDGRSDDGNGLDESEEVPPEVRRELERHRLAQEEKRVADAGAAYRQRMYGGNSDARGRPMRPSDRAVSIQSKVKSLLDEAGQPSPTKTAQGYGRFTQSPDRQYSLQQQNRRAKQVGPQTQTQTAPSGLRREPAPANTPPSSFTPTNPSRPSQLSSSPIALPERTSSRPNAPPKPQHKPQALRTGAREDQRPPSPAKPPNLTGKALPTLPPKDNMSSKANDDWEANFSKKYPSLAGLEMVETEIDGGPSAGLKMREV